MPKTMSAQRTTWTKVAFGDVVQLSRERSSDPEKDGHERFIGLEHIDPGDLRLRRWGNVADGVTFTSVFRPGQVLFGKRRAYQRKVAVADFSGVCSGDIYVLEPKGKALLPELLPFICQTEAFFDHAVGTSAGSLSPRTNWESLASFEFTLPPIEEQRRISAGLNAMESALRSEGRAALALGSVLQARLRQVFGDGPRPPGFSWRLDDVCERIGDGTHLPPVFTESGVPFLLVGSISSGAIDWSVGKHVSEADYVALTRAFRPRRGDLLYTLVGSFGVPVVVETDRPFTFQRHIGLIRVDEAQVSVRYLYWYLRSASGIAQASQRAEGLAQKTITLGALRDFVLPRADRGFQDVIAQELDAIQFQLGSLSARIALLRQIRSCAIERFSEEASDVQRSKHC